MQRSSLRPLAGLPFALGFQVLRSFSTALSRPLPSLVVMVLAILFNALGDYGLIFGHFGLPRLGLLGAGMASACSNIFSFVSDAGDHAVRQGLKHYRILHRLGRLHAATLAELFRLGLPIGITMVFEVVFFNGASLAMGAFGIASIAAHQIAITIPSLTFMVPLGIGLAATVRVGLAAGAGDAVAARRAGFTAIAMGAGFMCMTAILLLCFPRHRHPLAAGYRRQQRCAGAGGAFLYVAAAFQLVDGMQVTASMCLRGLKDARVPMWLAGASYWLAGAPMCVLLGFGLGLQGLWHLAGTGFRPVRGGGFAHDAVLSLCQNAPPQREAVTPRRSPPEARSAPYRRAAGCGGPARGRFHGRCRDAAARRLPPPSATDLRHS